MFHQGSLQSGISLAIQEQKLVACFVRDNGDESTVWENDWLQSGWIANLLTEKSILLRLDAGSTEAGFLSAFCPISNIPTFVIIHNGQLREQLSSGVDKDDFINRVRTVLGADPIPGVTSQSTNNTAPPPQPATTSTSAASIPPTEIPQASSPTPPLAASSPAPEQPRPVSSTPAPSAKAKGKQKAVPPQSSTPNTSSTNAAQQAARDAIRKKKQEERDELARIQARIEQDKLARKVEAERRKAEREQQTQPNSDNPVSSSPATTRTTTSTKGSQSKQVNLNVRLFDGQTIRSRFPRTATLQDNVRSWIDTEVAKSSAAESPSRTQSLPPYYFKQIQAPLPSRELSTGEEAEPLGDIGLAPSATLVLIPVKGYTEAYSGSNGAGPIGNVVGGVTGLVGGAFGLAYNAVGLVGSTLGSIVGVGGGQGQGQTPSGRTLNDTPSENSTPPVPPPSSASSTTPPPHAIRVRTLADQRESESRRPQEFYNGNQLSFQPNDDDDKSTSNRK